MDTYRIYLYSWDWLLCLIVLVCDFVEICVVVHYLQELCVKRLHYKSFEFSSRPLHRVRRKTLRVRLYLKETDV